MSAAQVGSSPELLRLILPHLQHDRSSLYNLCLVNWTFSNVFSPILYQRLTLNAISKHSSQWRGEKLKHLLNDNLKYTRSIVGIRLNDISSTGIVDIDKDYPINEALCQILEKTPNLESILFNQIHLSHDSLHFLNSLPRLRNVTISFDIDYQHSIGVSDNVPDEPSYLWNLHGARFGQAPEYMEVWHNLTRLHLFELWGDIEPWKQCFVKVISQSAAQLQHLGMSLSEGCYVGDYEQGARLLCDICDEYATTGANVLKLKSLIVGYKISCPPLAQMQKLVDLSIIEELSIFNDSEGDFTWLCPVPWDIVMPAVSTSLQILSLEDLDEDVWANLDSLFDDTRHIGLRFESTFLEDDERHNAYDIFREHPETRLTELILPDPFRQDVSDFFGSLKHGSDHVVRLGLTLDPWSFGDDDKIDSCLVQLCEAVGTMPNLSALWLICSHDKPHAKVTPADYRGAATNIAKAASSLVYVRIATESFRIHHGDNGVQAVLLDESEDKSLCPRLFRVRYPVPLSCYDETAYLDWNEDLH